jgi:hypothetical protein
LKTRENFIGWAFEQKIISSNIIDKKRFYRLDEKEYVLSFIEQQAKEQEIHLPLFEDFLHLEKQRYHIVESHTITTEEFNKQAIHARKFCTLTKEEKRKGSFVMNPNLPKFLAQSQYSWDDDSLPTETKTSKHYFFIPSFLPINHKEIQLSGFNALFLDLINYQEPFSYEEFFELISGSIDLFYTELDRMLLDFLSFQTLYYGTIHYLPKGTK